MKRPLVVACCSKSHLFSFLFGEIAYVEMSFMRPFIHMVNDFREKNLQSLTRVYFVLETLFRLVYVIVLACWPHLTHKWDFNQFLDNSLVIISRSTTLNVKYSVLEHGIATGNLFLRVSPSYDEERSW